MKMMIMDHDTFARMMPTDLDCRDPSIGVIQLRFNIGNVHGSNKRFRKLI